jgi:hypothetical protein
MAHLSRVGRICTFVLCLTTLNSFVASAFAAPASPSVFNANYLSADTPLAGNFHGPIGKSFPDTPLPDVSQWLRDGRHYLEYAEDGTGESQLMRVDARSGNREPFYNSGKMQSAFTAALGAGSVTAAHEIAHRSRFLMDTPTRRISKSKIFRSAPTVYMSLTFAAA